MFSQSQMAIKYLRWWLTASNSKGHGMHSPFVFDFIIHVLNDDKTFDAFQQIAINETISKTERKINRLLFKMVDYYQPQFIISLEENDKLQTAYLRAANHQIAVIALKGFDESALRGITDKNMNIDFIVSDNSNTNNTEKCFATLLPFVNNDSFFIIKNIHASKTSENNWKAIQNHPAATATIDLFHLGIVLFNHDFKVKQHFQVRF